MAAHVRDRATRAIPWAEAWFGRGAFADMLSPQKTIPRVSGAHAKKTRAYWAYRWLLMWPIGEIKPPPREMARSVSALEFHDGRGLNLVPQQNASHSSEQAHTMKSGIR